MEVSNVLCDLIDYALVQQMMIILVVQIHPVLVHHLHHQVLGQNIILELEETLAVKGK